MTDSNLDDKNVVSKKLMSYECRVHDVVIPSVVSIIAGKFERSKP